MILYLHFMEVLYEDNHIIIVYKEAGEIVQGDKTGDEPLSIASISKLMTYYLVKESISEGKIKMEDKVKVSKNASSEEGSSLDLKSGEQISIKDLLDGLMIVSGNDSAVALAETIAETESKFVTMMNEKAKELGLQNSTFTNPSCIFSPIR